MFCRMCGVKSEEGSRFCDFCGTKLIETAEGRGNHFDDQEEFLDHTNKDGTYRENNREKKHFAILVFLSCTLVIALGFGVLFFLAGDGFSRNDGEHSDVDEATGDTDVITCESDLYVDLELITEEVTDDPEAVAEDRSDEPEDAPRAEDENESDLMDSEDEESILVGLWEGSFVTRGGTAYDLIIGIDANNQVTATYFQADEREMVFARYYGVAQLRGNDEVIIEYTSSSIRPAGWDESGIFLFGTLRDNTISGFFEFEREQTGTAILRTETLVTDVDGEQLYRIRLTWEDATSQVGAFVNLSNAINATPQGYSVFDGQGNVVFTRR